MEFVLNRASARARNARYNQILGKKMLITLLLAVGVLCVATGLAVVALEEALGWLVMLPGTLLLTLAFWQKGSLGKTSFGKFQQGSQILLHEALETEALARIRKDDLSAYDLWKALETSEERYFIGNRYMLDSSFFEQLADQTPGSAQTVWQQAERLRISHNAAGYTNILVLAAIVASVPNIDQIMKRIQLDLTDVETSIDWMRDILRKRALARASSKGGGIGRDWAFGYAPILRQLGHNISQGIEQHGFFSDTSMHEPIVQNMVQTMGQGNGTVTLVGDTGVGKTTSVYAFAERLLTDASVPARIRYNQVISLDAPSLIANAKNPGQLEDLVLRLLNEAHRAKNIVLFFDDAEAFFGGGPGSVDLTHVLQPAIDAGSVRLIFAMSPQDWQRLSSSGTVGKLTPINVPPADETNTIAVLRDAIGLTEYRQKVTYTYQALQESFKLGSRYVTNLAMPGAALKVLEQAANSQVSLITREAVQASVEQTYGIKLQQSRGDESSKLLSLEVELHKHVINQDRAVTVVADALRRSRAGVGNPNRPVGTFLFLGPTGVGKTELSKALARVYFGDENNLIRVDMNQYVESTDVSRLIQPMIGNELGFLGQVRKQPFSVILLDEIEKAHSSVVNALLQMLDEGVMRDSDSKAVSFKDAIIIATSNAGADEIRRMIDAGEDSDQAEAAFVETLISRGLFAPEFVNRFDEVVIFKPLTQDELVSVIDLIIDGINMTLDTQKVRVVLTDQAKRWLVEKGYDSKLGARPMRRMAQRYVENTIAKRLLDQSVQSGGIIELDVSDFETS